MKKSFSILLLGWILAGGFAFLPEVNPASALARQKSDQKLLGTLANGTYVFPGGQVRVKVPALLQPGAKIRDERAEVVTQVIFTDDFGFFYRVVVVALPRHECRPEQLMGVFKNPQTQEFIETERGRELRVLDLEKEGAEVTVTTISKDENGNRKTKSWVPDLLTANTLFQEDQFIVHVVAGVPLYEGATVANKTELVKKKLQQFLAGIEVVTGTKESALPKTASNPTNN